MQAILNYLDKYSAQIFVLQMGLLIILTGIILWVYFYNRKKYHNLKHQIPASVVKNYLDSIIQNSTALKSSLFRGGGLDIDANGVPSVLPVGKMESMGQVGISLDSVEGDDALKAEVARLQSELADKRSAISELEKKASGLEGNVSEKQERIEELEALLAKKGDAAGSSSAGESELASELEAIKQQRDELQEEVDQYAMIGDDLADLKRLKQENAQLKSALNPDDLDDIASELDKKDPVVEDEVSSDEEIEKEVEVANTSSEDDVEEREEVVAKTEEFGSEAEDAEPAAETEEVVAAKAPEDDEDNREDTPDKSPEDLLSEFEKMLG